MRTLLPNAAAANVQLPQLARDRLVPDFAGCQINMRYSAVGIHNPLIVGCAPRTGLISTVSMMRNAHPAT